MGNMRLLLLTLCLSSAHILGQTHKIVFRDTAFMQEVVNHQVRGLSLAKTWELKSGVADGHYKVYALKVGLYHPIMDVHVVNGEMDGWCRHYHHNSHTPVKRTDIRFVKGEKQGLSKVYNHRGVLASEVPFKDNQVSGLAKIYHESETLKPILYRSLEMQSGQAHGIMMGFDENLQHQMIYTYEYDSLKGDFVFFKENGDSVAYGSIDHCKPKVNWVGVDWRDMATTVSIEAGEMLVQNITASRIKDLKNYCHVNSPVMGNTVQSVLHTLSRPEHERLPISELSSFKNLKSIHAYKGTQDLYAFLDDHPGALTELRELNEVVLSVGNNQPVHKELLASRSITRLHLYVRGKVDPSFTRMQQLEYMYIGGSDPREDPASLPAMSNLINLRELRIHNVPLNSDFFWNAKGLTSLETCRISKSGLKSIPAAVGYWYNLEYFSVVQGEVNYIHPVLAKLKKLKKIMFDYTCHGIMKPILDANPNLTYDLWTSCFPGDALVVMANGSKKRIDKIEPGDKILGYEESMKKIVSTVVNKVHKHSCDTSGAMVVLTIRLSDSFQRLRTTPEHPVFTNGDWRKAEEIAEGDWVLRWEAISGKLRRYVVNKVSRVSSRPSSLYNLNTGTGTYLVDGIVVHNK